MNNIIARIVAYFRPATSVASLTSGLSKTVAQLEAHAQQQAAKVSALDEQIYQLNLQADEAAAEIMKATNVKTNIAKLLDADGTQGSLL